MKFLDKRQILLLHEDLIEKFGGVCGVRDENLLESAISSPFQTFGGSELYPTLIEKAARLGYGLIKNHPFLDGNKRIGTHAMLVFLALNNFSVKYEDGDLIEIILHVADNTLSYADFLSWLENHVEV